MNEALRIVVVAPDLDVADPHDETALAQAERSRSLRIGLLESGFNLVATLPGDVFLIDCRKPHDYRAMSEEGWSYRMAHFDGSVMPDYYAQILAAGTRNSPLPMKAHLPICLPSCSSSTIRTRPIASC